MSHVDAPEVVVVGAGAAGLMAAVSAAREGARTVLVDKRRKVGAKILVSGGTRCNVTNDVVRPEDYNTPSLPFVRNVLRELTPEATRRFFEAHGVALKLEPTGKYFPVSDSARDVLAGLLRACDAAGVDLRREVDVTGVAFDGDRFRLATGGAPIEAPTVVVCTGGLSLPETGSDGAGYAIARAFGHRVVRTSPALTPLVANPAPHARLAGVSLAATLSVVADGRVVAERTGSLLFTHAGYSGPVAMDVSRHWIRRGWEADEVAVRASFVPGRDRDSLEGEWLAEARRAPRRKAASLLAEWLPNRLAEDVAARSGTTDVALGAATRDERRRALAEVVSVVLPVTGVAGYAKAEVTAGGVALDEVVARTLESKLRPGLFFAGEVLDVEGYIGGFNFQWAWSSGWVAGRAAARAAR